MRIVASVVAVGAILVGAAVATDAKPKKQSTKAKPKIQEGLAAKAGFYKILVKPNAKWVLHKTYGDEKWADRDTVTVETYDVRKVGNADVARLRWTHNAGTDHPDVDFLNTTRININMTQVAVTSAGLYLLTKDMDDAKVAAALKGKPSRSDPPKAYKGTKLNDGRYLSVSKDMVCFGRDPLPEEGECGDVCGGELCISATDGIIGLGGDWGPDLDDYAKDPPPGDK